MSEVKEHSVIYLSSSDDPEREWCQDDVWEGSVRYNLGDDFDRVTAERDALQVSLTAADEELDRAGGAYLNKNSECLQLRKRVDVLEGLLLQTNELLYAIQGDPGAVPSSSIDAMRGEVFTALKPAEGSTCNQIREEIGLPINTTCQACGRGACIDR